MVYINGEFSWPINIVCGVPQDCCLGPLLFSIYINDLPSALSSADITLYAGDITPYEAAENVSLLYQNLQEDLVNVEKWATKTILC